MVHAIDIVLKKIRELIPNINAFINNYVLLNVKIINTFAFIVYNFFIRKQNLHKSTIENNQIYKRNYWCITKHIINKKK